MQSDSDETAEGRENRVTGTLETEQEKMGEFGEGRGRERRGNGGWSGVGSGDKGEGEEKEATNGTADQSPAAAEDEFLL
ncbi:hypothetical protein T4D_1910 [Trichinella pseudospiralis]|uniref:Uncharacterized protein n=1 Tax=Trichinella pseudospiralis TaxID=6337 RepID=A0A0V1FIV7_TRIPS|nr:hypothetical protein T4D_1910 [Trichinella pseudospiralis]